MLASSLFDTNALCTEFVCIDFLLGVAGWGVGSMACLKQLLILEDGSYFTVHADGLFVCIHVCTLVCMYAYGCGYEYEHEYEYGYEYDFLGLSLLGWSGC